MNEEPDPDPSRRSPVGEPVVRADPAVTGERARDAVEFDPEDPESVARAVETIREFAVGGADEDHVLMLRGAAACAALVRGVGSYKAAAERAGEGVSIAFIRKWARVHDLPEAIRRHVARGDIAPTAAKHVARIPGEGRYLMAFAAVDANLTVREVRSIASAVNDGATVAAALMDHGVDPGRVTVDLPVDEYVQLRRRAALTDREPGVVVGEALAARFAEE